MARIWALISLWSPDHQVLPHHLFDGPLVAISCLRLVGKVGEVLFVSLADAFCPLVVKLKAGLRQRLFELRHQLDQLRWGLKLFKSLEERFLQLGEGSQGLGFLVPECRLIPCGGGPFHR